jgi:hypothetical protein
MPKAPQGKHWTDKVEKGTYVSPCMWVKQWKKEYVELFNAMYDEKERKEAETQLPWARQQMPVYGGNRFVKTGNTGRYLWMKLKALADLGKLTLHVDEDKAKGFLGIVGIEVPKESIAVFDGAPMPSRQHVHAKYANDKERTKAWKTIDKSWRIFGMMEQKRESDGALVFKFEEDVAETVSQQHKRPRNRNAKQTQSADDLEGDEESEEEEEEVMPKKAKPDQQPFAALQMLASISTSSTA